MLKVIRKKTGHDQVDRPKLPTFFATCRITLRGKKIATVEIPIPARSREEAERIAKTTVARDLEMKVKTKRMKT